MLKKFFIDKISVLFIGVLLVVSYPYLFSPSIVPILSVSTIVLVLLPCWQIVVLPIDLLVGPITQIGYFSQATKIMKLYCFQKYYSYFYRFYINQKKEDMLVPNSISEKDIATLSVCVPPKDTKLEITYYRFSRIFVKWLVVADGDTPGSTGGG